MQEWLYHFISGQAQKNVPHTMESWIEGDRAQHKAFLLATAFTAFTVQCNRCKGFWNPFTIHPVHYTFRQWFNNKPTSVAAAQVKFAQDLKSSGCRGRSKRPLAVPHEHVLAPCDADMESRPVWSYQTLLKSPAQLREEMLQTAVPQPPGGVPDAHLRRKRPRPAVDASTGPVTKKRREM